MFFNSVLGFLGQFAAIGAGIYLVFPPPKVGKRLKGIHIRHATKCATIAVNVLLVMFLAHKAFAG